MTHPVPPIPDGRQLLRHTLATLAYRASKAVRGAPASFSTFSVADGSRTPGQILAHLGDLMDWALTQARGQQKWTDTPPGDWNADVDRFFRSLSALDALSRVRRRVALRRVEDLSGRDRRFADARWADQHASSHRGSAGTRRELRARGHRGRSGHARAADAARRVRLTGRRVAKNVSAIRRRLARRASCGTRPAPRRTARSRSSSRRR